jgi:hypothetical protein
VLPRPPPQWLGKQYRNGRRTKKVSNGEDHEALSRLLKNDLDHVISSSKSMPGTSARYQLDERARKTAQSLSKPSKPNFFSSLLVDSLKRQANRDVFASDSELLELGLA